MGFYEQLERVRRWYERFESINNGMPHTKPSDFYLDDVYAFFINCHQLKDWIKNDPAIRPKKGVEDFIREPKNWCLRLCADVSNGAKHLEFRSRTPPRTGKKPEYTRTFYLELADDKDANIAIEVVIITSRGKRNAFKVATECLARWERFVRRNI